MTKSHPSEHRYSLSPLQAGMLAQQLRATGAGTDIEQIVCTLPEAVDIAALRAAWERVVDRHAVLRTAFRWDDVPEPVQEVHAGLALPFESLDWRDVPPSARAERLEAFLREDRRRGLDLARAPLLRLTLLCWGPAEYQLVWTFHHAILDGRSFTIVLQEFLTLYDDGGAALDAAPVPFRQHVEAIASQDWRAARPFWAERLGDVTAATPLPAGPRRAVAGAERQGDRTVQLDAAATEALVATAAHAGVTLNTLVQGAWAILLGRHAEQSDVIFGVVRAGRHSSVPGAEGMVGLLINTLPLRVRVDGAMPLGEWLRTVRGEWNALREVEQSPLAAVQGCAKLASGQPLFETVVMFERQALETQLQQGGGRSARRGFRLHEQNGFALTLTAYGGPALMLRLEFDASRYDAATVEALLDQLRTLLQGFPAQIHQPVSACSLLSPAGRDLVVRAFNDTARAMPDGETLVDLLETCATATPDAPAVEDERATLSYRALHAAADRVAAALQASGARPGERVGVSLERSNDLAVALLAVLKTGAAYVPFDPEYPAARLAFMIEDSGVRLLLTQRSLAGRFEAGAATMLFVEEARNAVAGATAALHAPRPAAGDAAYMIYTSGSTGRPKGALNGHRGIVNRLRWMRDEYAVGPEDAVLQKTPISFDVSVWEFFLPLISGARLVMARPGGHRDPEYLADVIARTGVSLMHFVPSMLQAYLAGATAADAPTLRDVICSGEALSVDLCQRFFARLPHARLHNLYGPTEAAVDVSSWRCRPDERLATVPIGRPVANTQLYVLDGRHHPLPVGVPGELYIAGVQVGMGYHARPELTAERFVADLFSADPAARMYRTGDRARWLANGALEYLGRIDQQVKLHGQRLELGEIEADLAAQPGVAAAAATLWKDEQGERLVAYYVAETGAKVDPSALRAALARLLPTGLVPTAFVPLTALPLMPNGKLDRGALPAPSVTARVDRIVVQPATPAERALAGIWEAVLRRGPVGTTDNFFELGGDSILMIQIVARARSAGVRITLTDFFARPTVGELAAAATVDDGPSLTTAAEVTSAPLTPIQRWFFASQPEAPDQWNQGFLFDVPTDFDDGAFGAAVGSVVAQHDALRLRFTRDGDAWRQDVTPAPADAPFDTVDLGDMPPDELGAAIQSRCDELHRMLDIRRGHLFRARYLRTGPTGGRVLLAAHHLAVDGISWRVLLEDLEAAYRGQAPGAPTGATFLQWAAGADAFGRGAALDDEREYWRAQPAGNRLSLPVDRAPTAVSIEANSSVVSVGLDGAETAALLQRVPASYQSQINDVLVTALGRALEQWAGGGSLVIDLEGHGREELVHGTDVSRTVGWFTSVFPVRLALPLPADSRAALRRVKQQLRDVPRRGAGYGLLRERGDGSVPADPAELLFNYFGQLDSLVGESRLFRFAAEPAGRWRAGAARRAYALQVDALVIHGRFEIRWSYDATAHDEATIRRVADSFVAALRALIAGSNSAGSVRYAAADFPLAALDQATLDQIVAGATDIEEIYPLVPMQRLFLGHAIPGGNDPGFEQWRYHAVGAIDADALRRAWQSVIDRHAILRTAFVAPAGGEPLQVVHGNVQLPWRCVDWRTVPPADRQQRLDELLAADRHAGFAPDAAPLMRFAVVQWSDDEFDLIWSHHHLLLDRWSWALVLRDVQRSYLAALEQRGEAIAPPLSYREFVRWLADQDAAAAERYWRGALASAATQPLFARRGGGDPGAAESTLALDATETTAIKAAAARARVGGNTLVQGAWALWLSHYLDMPAVTFGVSVAGRPGELAGAERIVGMTINNVPVRVEIDPAGRLAGWLRSLQARQGEVQRFGHVALGTIHQWTGLPPHHRLFESLLVFQDATSEDIHSQWLGDSVVLTRHHAMTRTGYPISLVVGGGERLTLTAAFDPAYFVQETAGQILGELRMLLVAMANPATDRLGALSALLPADGRGAGRAEPADRGAESELVAAVTAAERVVARLWAELLGRDRIGMTDNFFARGGHSLLALQLVSRVRDRLRIDVPIRTLFANPVLADFTRAVVALERRPGQVERIAELVLQVDAMTNEQLGAAAATLTPSNQD